MDDLRGMLAADGEVMIAPEDRALICFSQGVAWAALVTGTSKCPIRPDGHALQRQECRATH